MAPRWPRMAQDGPKLAKIAQIWPKRATSWPKIAPICPQDGPKIAPAWPQHGRTITQVDPNMDAKCRQHVKGSVEWRKPLEYK
jgi:hypothetical protein